MMLAALAGVILTVIGIRFLLWSESAAKVFGIEPRPQGLQLHHIVGLRDLWLGLLALALLLMFGVRTAPPAPSLEPDSWHTLLEGLRFVWRRKIILGAVSLDLFAVLLGGATALLPIFAKDILFVGPLGLAYLCVQRRDREAHGDPPSPRGRAAHAAPRPRGPLCRASGADRARDHAR